MLIVCRIPIQVDNISLSAHNPFCKFLLRTKGSWKPIHAGISTMFSQGGKECKPVEMPWPRNPVTICSCPWQFVPSSRLCFRFFRVSGSKTWEQIGRSQGWTCCRKGLIIVCQIKLVLTRKSSLGSLQPSWQAAKWVFDYRSSTRNQSLFMSTEAGHMAPLLTSACVKSSVVIKPRAKASCCAAGIPCIVR